MVGEQPGVVTTSMRRVGCQEPTVTPHSKPAQLQKDWVATPSGIRAAEELMPAMRMGKRQLKQKVSTMLAERMGRSVISLIEQIIFYCVFLILEG